ncbi:SpoIIE family protein phosphatase [Pseudofrankia saprophytica]|uniref:SpoIIE family protein phosphatase n=1 Tax=Pseudofrankia saprophytica TaxID=298655 RepID=UPI000234DB0F|nr:SpoIIE family protein phosphatase [Pseudofrankia saprophytica]
MARTPQEPEQSPERRNRLLDIVIRQRQRIFDLEARAADAHLVDLAVGLLMARLGASPADAADQLRLLAHTAGVGEAEFAAELLGEPRPTITALAAAPAKARAWRRLWRAATVADHAADGDAVAQAVLREGLATHGACAVALWMLEPDGALTLVGQHGLSALDASRWRRVPPQLDCAASRAAAQGQPVWWPAGTPPLDADAGPPPTSPTLPPPSARLGPWDGARAALPLLNAGTLVGAVEICWDRPMDADGTRLLRELTALADVCQRALRPRAEEGDGPAEAAADADPAGGGGGGRVPAAWLPALLDGLAGSVLLARAMRDGAGEVVDFQITFVNSDFVDPAGLSADEVRGARLLDLYPLMGADDGLFGHAVDVLRTGAPYAADRTVLLCLVGDALVSREMDIRVTRHADGVAISWRFTDGADAPASLGAHVQRLGGFGGWQEDVGSGAIRWTDNTYDLFHLPRSAPPISLEDLRGHVHAEDRDAFDQFRAALPRLGRAATASFRVLLPGGGQRHWRTFAEPVTDTASTLVAVRGVYQDLTHQYRTELVLHATQSQLADSEARAASQHRLAIALQKAILPEAQPLLTTSGLAVAVRYRPAEQESLVGGDWYDAIVLPDGQILLAVGDVAGHSIRSVAGMTALRNGLRGLAVTGAGPGELLRWLNNVACHLMDDITATVICGLYRPQDRALRWARAGHLPPVLVRDGRSAVLAAPDGLLLGVMPDVSYEETVTQLTPGDALLLYTDGLVERRGTGLDESLRDLRRLAAMPHPDVGRRADFLLAHCTPDTDDDTCLVIIELQP